MRRACLCVAGVVLLAGCDREPTFDERYDAAQTKLEQKAREIDAQAQGSGVPAGAEDDAEKAR